MMNCFTGNARTGVRVNEIHYGQRLHGDEPPCYSYEAACGG
jgi:hypothetical protein